MDNLERTEEIIHRILHLSRIQPRLFQSHRQDIAQFNEYLQERGAFVRNEFLRFSKIFETRLKARKKLYFLIDHLKNFFRFKGDIRPSEMQEYMTDMAFGRPFAPRIEAISDVNEIYSLCDELITEASKIMQWVLEDLERKRAQGWDDDQIGRYIGGQAFEIYHDIFVLPLAYRRVASLDRAIFGDVARLQNWREMFFRPGTTFYRWRQTHNDFMRRLVDMGFVRGVRTSHGEPDRRYLPWFVEDTDMTRGLPVFEPVGKPT
jgi:hypothetical protein